jgi:hypothetical protein
LQRTDGASADGLLTRIRRLRATRRIAGTGAINLAELPRIAAGIALLGGIGDARPQVASHIAGEAGGRTRTLAADAINTEARSTLPVAGARFAIQ